jgi:hypothetical protein
MDSLGDYKVELVFVLQVTVPFTARATLYMVFFASFRVANPVVSATGKDGFGVLHYG